jgi:hypothetical protein
MMGMGHSLTRPASMQDGPQEDLSSRPGHLTIIVLVITMIILHYLILIAYLPTEAIINQLQLIQAVFELFLSDNMKDGFTEFWNAANPNRMMNLKLYNAQITYPNWFSLATAFATEYWVYTCLIRRATNKSLSHKTDILDEELS